MLPLMCLFFNILHNMSLMPLQVQHNQDLQLQFPSLLTSPSYFTFPLLQVIMTTQAFCSCYEFCVIQSRLEAYLGNKQSGTPSR